AVDHINAAGGVLGKKVEVVLYDDHADPKEATALARKLIEQDEVKAFVAGSYSMPSRAVAPLFNDEKIPLVAAYAVHPDVTMGGKLAYSFRNGFLGTVEGKAAGYTCVKILKGKKIAVLTSDNDFGKEMAAGFKAFMETPAGKGAQVVSYQTYPMSEKDYKPYLSKIKGDNPDIVFSGGYYFQSGPMVKQAREMGINAQFVGEEGADSPEFVSIAGPASEGFVIVTNLNRDDKRPLVQTFLKEYKAQFKVSPDMVGASAYDAFMIICEGIKRANSLDGAAIQKAIAGVQNYNGLTGTIRGFNKGEVVKDVQVQVVKGGDFHYKGVVNDPSLITP
ncbi:MAG TPA: ABC transporter substrate-binding protein, partial [Holophaga sp.]|nr:ABC transporter substrate-binding protein [Holophaga sp.]